MAAQAGEDIALAALPSWVQAMRPVEISAPIFDPLNPAAILSWKPESPLAGLQGVLPVWDVPAYQQAKYLFNEIKCHERSPNSGGIA